LAVVAGMKKRMTMQNRQMSNAKRKGEKEIILLEYDLFYSYVLKDDDADEGVFNKKMFIKCLV